MRASYSRRRHRGPVLSSGEREGQRDGDGEAGRRRSTLDREGRERLPDGRPVVEQQLTLRGVESHFPAGLPSGLQPLVKVELLMGLDPGNEASGFG
jgi:hypothetical protein